MTKLLGIALTLTLIVARPVAACPLPAGADPSLANVSDEARLAFLRDRLDVESKRATTWTYTWIIANGVLIAGTAGALLFYPKNSWADIYVGIPATTIAALPLILLPPDIERDGRDFMRAVSIPPTDQCALIARGEKLFATNARSETWATQWIPQVANALYNLAVGLVLGLGFNRWTSGGTAMLTGFTIGELVMYTQPRTLPDEWNGYLSGTLPPAPAKPLFTLVPATNGIGLGLTF